MAPLEFKPNWDETRERMIRWWKRENTDRPMMRLAFPRPDFVHPNLNTPQKIEDQWLDIDYLIRLHTAHFTRMIYLAESFPDACANLGPGTFGVYLGCRTTFAPDTVWYDPIVKDVTELELAFDPQNRFWLWTIEITRRLVEAGRGRFPVTVPDLIENLDTLAALVGTERILLDLIEHPAAVHAAQKKLLPLWFKYFDELYRLVEIDGGNTFIAFQIWGPGRTAKLQCDMSAMISPEMFHEFVEPYLDKQTRGLDFTLYHLDGPSALGHLDALLGLEQLTALQWTPGEGKPSGGDPCWDGIYRKALDAGKAIQVSLTPPEARDFTRRFGKRGVYFLVWGDLTEAEGRRFVSEAATW